MERAEPEHMLGAQEGPVVLMGRPLSTREVTFERGSRGFTLIELMVAIVLLAILVKLALPSFTLWINNAKVRTVAESLQTGIRLAQTEAVRQNRSVVLAFTNGTPGPSTPITAVANGNRWVIQTLAQFGGADGSFVQAGSLTDVAAGVTITGVSALCFNSNGRLADAAVTAAIVQSNTTPQISGAACAPNDATFTVDRSDSADRPLKVMVSASGKVRMCDPKRPTLSTTSPDGCPAS